MKKAISMTMTGVFLAVYIFLGGAAYGEDNLIHGCYKKKKGWLRIVEDSGGCKKKEKPISWSANALQNSLCDEPKIITVDCSKGETISDALKSACPGETILVAGDCKESIVITSPNLDRIVIDGQGSATINGDTSDAIKIDGAQGVVIRGFPSLSGYSGLYALRGAAFEAHDIEIQNTSFRGLQVHENSTAKISNLTVVNSGQDGIQIGYGSSAILEGMIKSDNNGNSGISAIANSNLNMFDAEVNVKKNGRTGLDARIESSVFLWDTTFISSENDAHGAEFSESSTLALYGDNNEFKVQDNIGEGLRILGSSAFNLNHGATLTVTGNGKRGIGVRGSSNANFYGNTIVQKNKWYGMEIDINSSGVLDGSMSFSENIESGLKLARSSTFFVYENGNLIVRETGGPWSAGIEVRGASVFRAQGNVKVENTWSTGDWSGVGIRITRSSSLTLDFWRNEANFIIQNNQGIGVQIDFQSSCRLKENTRVSNNTGGGISAKGNSFFSARDIAVEGNDNYGIRGDDGSSIDIHNSTIKNPNATDVTLSFGARSTLQNNIMETIDCDDTVISRGDPVCPNP